MKKCKCVNEILGYVVNKNYEYEIRSDGLFLLYI